MGFLFFSQDPAWISELAHLHGHTQTGGITPLLLHKGEIRFKQRVHTNQFDFVFGNGQQRHTLNGRHDLSAWHGEGV